MRSWSLNGVCTGTVLTQVVVLSEYCPLLNIVQGGLETLDRSDEFLLNSTEVRLQYCKSKFKMVIEVTVCYPLLNLLLPPQSLKPQTA